MSYKKCIEFKNLIETVSRIIKNSKYDETIDYGDIIVENGFATVSIVYNDEATVKNISKLYKDVLCLYSVLNYNIKFETELYCLNLVLEDVDEVDWAEYCSKTDFEVFYGIRK